MRYSSKKGLWAVITLLGGASVLASACGGSGGDDRNGGTAGSGNAPAGAGASATAGASGASTTAGAGGGSPTACDPATQCCATAKCACPYPVADGTGLLIADMEDGKTTFKPAGVATAAGYWDFSRDASMGTVTPSGTPNLMAAAEGANGTAKSLHVQGANLTGWGAALAAEMSNGCPFDASAYGGISFWAKGSSSVLEGANKLLVLVGNPEFIPAPIGFCDEKAVPADENCYARHRVQIELTPAWKEYIVAWEDLQAPSYLTFGPKFGANRIRDIVFNASGPSPAMEPAASFDFYVDELKFVPKGTKGNVGGGTAGSGAGGGSSAGAGGASTAGAGGASAGSGGAAAGSGGTAGT